MTSDKLTVIGLDLSLAKAGYAIAESTADGFKVVKYDIARPPSTGATRLDWWFRWAKDNLLVADLVVLENYAYARVNQAAPIGEAGGVVRLALYRMGTLTAVPTPTQVKKWMTGKGNANKTAMSLAVYKTLGIETCEDDEADALALMHMGLAILDIIPVTNQAQRDVVPKINYLSVTRRRTR